MSEKKDIEMWAVKAPWGKLWIYGVGAVYRTRRNAIGAFVNGDEPPPYNTWKHWYRRGWRCVKVRVQEIEHD